MTFLEYHNKSANWCSENRCRDCPLKHTECMTISALDKAIRYKIPLPPLVNQETKSVFLHLFLLRAGQLEDATDVCPYAAKEGKCSSYQCAFYQACHGGEQENGIEVYKSKIEEEIAILEAEAI